MPSSNKFTDCIQLTNTTTIDEKEDHIKHEHRLKHEQTATLSTFSVASPAIELDSGSRSDSSGAGADEESTDSVQLPESCVDKNLPIFYQLSKLSHQEYLDYIMTFTPLSMMQFRKQIFSTRNQKNQNIMCVGKESLFLADFKVLFSVSGKEWYGDGIINMYLLHVLNPRQMVLYGGIPTYRPWKYLSSHFVHDLLNEEKLDNNLRGKYHFNNWYSKQDFSNARGIVIPYNMNKNHWVLIVVDFESRTISFIDSMFKTAQEYQEYATIRLEAVKKYLIDRKNSLPHLNPNIDDEAWKFQFTDVSTTTQQKDGFNCGVFCCIYADMIQLNYPLSFPATLPNKYRNYVCHQIVNFWSEDTTIA